MKFSVEPRNIPIDQKVDVTVIAELDIPLRSGNTISFALPEAWASQRYCVTFTREPQLASPDAEDHAEVIAEGAEFETHLEGVYLPSGDQKGHVRKITAKLIDGSLEAGSKVFLSLHNYRSTWVAEEGTIRVWVGDNEESSTPELRTIPMKAERIRIIIPSSAMPREEIEVNIVSLDPFWNLSSSYCEGVLSLEGGGILEEGISFKGSYLTFISIPNSGIHRLRFRDKLSNPIRITSEPQGPLWGDLHSHDKTHNCGAGENPYKYARKVSCLDFVAVTPDYRGVSSAEAWSDHVSRCNRAYDPGQFTTILGYEVGFRKGHYNVYFRGSKAEVFNAKDPSLRSMENLLSTLSSETSFVVPHHLGVDWCPQAEYPPEWDSWIPILEIYSQHGLGEFYQPEHVLAYEFNRTRGLENKYAASTNKPVYARDAWNQGRHYGVIASSDDHIAQPGKPVKGLAAVFASENTREALFNSLKSRRTYGTTGERILLNFRINGCEMGQEILAKKNEALTIEIEVHGTDEIAFVEVAQMLFIRKQWKSIFFEKLLDRNIFHEKQVKPELDYSKNFNEVFTGDAVYYLRVAQRKQIADWPVFAWSSPIWVKEESRNPS